MFVQIEKEEGIDEIDYLVLVWVKQWLREFFEEKKSELFHERFQQSKKREEVKPREPHVLPFLILSREDFGIWNRNPKEINSTTESNGDEVVAHVPFLYNTRAQTNK